MHVTDFRGPLDLRADDGSVRPRVTATVLACCPAATMSGAESSESTVWAGGSSP